LADESAPEFSPEFPPEFSAGSSPPAFCIFSFAEPETAPILKMSFFVNLPLP
jgi:hypothetical protein